VHHFTFWHICFLQKISYHNCNLGTIFMGQLRVWHKILCRSMWPCHSSDGLSLDSHCGSPASQPDQSGMRYLWCTKWQLRFIFQVLWVSPVTHIHSCYHLQMHNGPISSRSSTETRVSPHHNNMNGIVDAITVNLPY
jgi:hypothetical protein